MSYKKGKKTRYDTRQSIPEFFSEKSVFITGGTGFLGKVLVEKLLRSCPEVTKIYLLMRPKSNKSLEERLNDMTSLPIFVKIKRQDEKALKKIIPVNGDVSEINLGLSEEDRKILEEEVSVVFHVAASVRFDDPLKKAILLNTRGTYEMVKLAQNMKRLESFVHVSTAYCNTHKDIIDEIVYPAPADWREIIEIAEKMDKDTLEVFCGKILGFYPNTYTFTKGLAEHVILDHADSIPAVVFRPTIVVSSIVDPLPGWIDNFNGPVGLIVASGKGLIRTLYSDPDIMPDYMPVDVAVKAMITAGWNRATSDEDFTDLPVYNCSANEVKRITQREMIDIGRYVTTEIPLNDILWISNPQVTKSKFLHYIKVFLFHFLPALAFDTVLKLLKRKPLGFANFTAVGIFSGCCTIRYSQITYTLMQGGERPLTEWIARERTVEVLSRLMKIHRKIFVANLALEYFLTRHWSFKHDRCFALNFKILEEDSPQFSYNLPDNFDVIEYYRNCAYGARQYLLHEDNVDLPEARKHQRRMYWLDKITKSLFLILMTYLALRFQLVQKLRSCVYFVFALLINFD